MMRGLSISTSADVLIACDKDIRVTNNDLKLIDNEGREEQLLV